MNDHLGRPTWRKACVKVTVLSFLLIGLPLLGVGLNGKPVGTYLHFPPRVQPIDQRSFSPLAFTLLALTVGLLVAPFLLHGLRYRLPPEDSPVHPGTGSMPWWGWLGLGIGSIGWIFAWTRFPWFQTYQLYTFTPLWVAYILVINGLTQQRTGTCLMLRRPRFFASLFFTSALFWWYFEYLNQFVVNWYYLNVNHLSDTRFFVRSTLPFSTVLPAVLSTREWLQSFRWPQKFTHGRFPARGSVGRPTGWFLLVASMIGLVGIGSLPHILFPYLWVAPFFILLGLDLLQNDHHFLESLGKGDWRPLLTSAVAALICGFFWEMWNFHSLAKWVYSIPLVYGFKVFEMPLLGYAGYLPFGLECAIIGYSLDFIQPDPGVTEPEDDPTMASPVSRFDRPHQTATEPE